MLARAGDGVLCQQIHVYGYNYEKDVGAVLVPTAFVTEENLPRYLSRERERLSTSGYAINLMQFDHFRRKHNDWLRMRHMPPRE
jgi:hypothetical protein